MSDAVGVPIQGGMGAATETVVAPVNTYAGVAIQLTGTFVGTITFEATVDNATWVAFSVTPAGGGAAVTTATTTGLWQGTCGGYLSVRARCSAYTSGTAYASIGASVGVGAVGAAASGVDHVIVDSGTLTAVTAITNPVTVAQATAANLNATVVQGTGTNLHVVTDSTSTTAVTQATGTNLHAVVDSGTITTVTTVTGITNQVDTNLKQVAGQNTATGGVNGSLAVGGNVATNVAIGTNPINLGAQGVSSENTAVTTSRMVQLVADLVGKLIVLPYSNPENFVSGTITSAMTSTTTTSLLAAPAGSLRNYITQITVSNASTTVPTDILIQDGSGGTTLYVVPAPAGTGTGTGAAGATITFPVPLRQPTAATALFVANVTTGSSTKVSATGYKGL